MEININKDDLFHILHKAKELINEQRTDKDKLIILDSELNYATNIIFREDIIKEVE